MTKLKYRKASYADVDLYYRWSNDPLVRRNSFKQDNILYSDHVNWFKNKLNSEKCHFYLFLDAEDEAVGQVRIDSINNETIIGLSIDESFRGKGLGVEMLDLACRDYRNHSNDIIVAYIKKNNISSYKIFKKAGFGGLTEIMMENEPTYRLIKI